MQGMELLNDEIRGGGVSEAHAHNEKIRNQLSTIPDSSSALPNAPLSPDTSLSSGASLTRPLRPRIQKRFVRESGGGGAEKVITVDDEILVRHLSIPDSSSNQRGGAGISLDAVGVDDSGGGENITTANAPIFADPPSPASSTSSSRNCPRPIRISVGNFRRGTYDLAAERERARRRVFKFMPGEMQKLAGIFWRRIGSAVQDGWKRRAVYLNSLVPVGVFLEIPAGVSDFAAVALRSMTEELLNVRRLFRSAVMRRPKRGVNNLFRSFGCERVELFTQSFASFPLSLLLQSIIFGEDLKNLRRDEIVYTKKKTTILHIRSACRLQELFSVRGLCLVLISEGDVTYSCYPKVFFRNNTFGYTVDDDPADRSWRVHMESNIVIDINSLPCLPDLSYDYGSCASSATAVSDYWPIRIMLRGAKMLMTFSCVALSVNMEGTDTRTVEN